MSEFSRWLAERVKDGALLPASVVEQRFRELGAVEPEVVTTRGARERLGFSVKYWRLKAESGEVEGAWFDGIWRLPLASCKRHLLRKENRSQEFKPRGPSQKKTA